MLSSSVHRSLVNIRLIKYLKNIQIKKNLRTSSDLKSIKFINISLSERYF